MISLERLTYTYPGADRPVFVNLDLEIEAGEFVLLAGRSGSGKSTILRVINGLVPHFHGGVLRGRARVESRDPIEAAPRGMADLVGFVGQDPEAHFVADLVEDELAFAMENHGLAPRVMARRIDEVLERLSIRNLRWRSIDTLSGGEKQRVAIASVLTLRPRVLVLDEPTSQLDADAARDVLEALAELRRGEDLTVLVAEHRLDRLLPFVDRVALLDADAEQEISIRVGPPHEILADSPLLEPPPVHEPRRRRPRTRRRRERRRGDRGEPPAIEAEGLRFRYPEAPRETLAGVDLRVEKGEILALVGPNGAGKSTLLGALVGLRRLDRGQVRIHHGSERSPEHGPEPLDPSRRHLAEITRAVGMVTQNPSRLLFHDTVEEELAFGLRRRSGSSGPKSPVAVERAREFARRCRSLGIDALRPRDPRDLSTGERQRVAIAAVLAPGPDVLLLDEPTRGLDAPAKANLAEWLRALSEHGVAVVLATHDLDLARACADRAVLLEAGRIVRDGRPSEVLS